MICIFQEVAADQCCQCCDGITIRKRRVRNTFRQPSVQQSSSGLPGVIELSDCEEDEPAQKLAEPIPRTTPNSSTNTAFVWRNKIALFFNVEGASDGRLVLDFRHRQRCLGELIIQSRPWWWNSSSSMLGSSPSHDISLLESHHKISLIFIRRKLYANYF